MIAQEAPAGGRGWAAALPALSPEVAAAQERLWALRRRHGVTSDGRRATSDKPIALCPRVTTTRDGRHAPGGEPAASSRPPAPAATPATPTTPATPGAAAPHQTDWSAVARLGLYSQPLAEHLRRATSDERRATSRVWRTAGGAVDVASPVPTANDEPRAANQEPSSLATRPASLAEDSSLVTRHSSLVKVYPDVALGILRAKQSAAGRVWLLLRHHDAAGRGAVGAGAAARLLTGQGSALRVCGRRQLANLLAAGDGLFWERRADVIWLRSTVRVAAALGVARLGGSPVGVPLSALTGKIGDVRAHLYASFHSGRQTADLLTGRHRPRGPIARATLARLSAAAPNSQRAYERRAGVGRRSAVAVGPRLGAVDAQETAWRRGRALFQLRDRDGRFGRPGAIYLAWQLPNEYTGPHATLARGRQKRLNRALADLFHDGMTGNGGRGEEGVRSGQWAVGSGQWVSGSVGQFGGGRAAVGGRSWSVVCRASSSGVRPSAVGRRFYYGSAKSAALARGGGERYWRGPAGAWYWQPELRVTNDELRMKRATTDDRPQTAAPSELVTRHS